MLLTAVIRNCQIFYWNRGSPEAGTIIQVNFPHGRQRETTLVSGSKIQTRRSQIHGQPRTQHRDNALAVSNGSIQALKNSIWPEFEASDSTERRQRSGSKGPQKFGLITSVSGQIYEAWHHGHSQISVQPWMHLPINTDYSKSDLCNIFKVQKV